MIQALHAKIYFYMDTADFNAENVNPQIVENYDEVLRFGDSGFTLDSRFSIIEQLQGTNLDHDWRYYPSGADDKSGNSFEITTAIWIPDSSSWNQTWEISRLWSR